SGLLLGGVLMLVHIDQTDAAERVHNAWLRTIEDGIHTYDIFTENVSKRKVGTKEFAAAVVERLGQTPQTLKPVHYKHAAPAKHASRAEAAAPKSELVGVDVYVEWSPRTTDDLAAQVEKANGGGLKIDMIDNRGVKVWPGGMSETLCTDSFRCRFLAPNGSSVTSKQVLDLLRRVDDLGLNIAKTENLRTYDGQPGFTLAQGQ
ncbi:MAG: NADP-dependent isocitrate dehydrogenase, partial [Bryobacteraceae bacterium]